VGASHREVDIFESLDRLSSFFLLSWLP